MTITKKDLQEVVKPLATKKETDELAGMVKRGFDGVHDRFSDVDARLYLVDTKLDRADHGQEPFGFIRHCSLWRWP